MGLLLNTLQRMLRKHDNPTPLSFDAASPFRIQHMDKRMHTNHGTGKFGYFMDHAFDQQELVDSTMAILWFKLVMSRPKWETYMSMGAQDKNGNYKFSKGQPTDKQPTVDAEGIQYMQNVIALLGTHKVILYGSQCIQSH